MLRSLTPTSIRSSVRLLPLAARRISLALFAGLFTAVLMGNLVSAPCAWGEELKAGDRVIFLGDSITQGGVSPKGYVTLVGKQLQESKKDLNVEIIGAGISGNKVPDLEKRLERDVLSKKPSIVVIYIGINDVWHSLNNRGTSKEEFQAGLKRIIDAIQKGGARVVLCTPSVIGEKTDGSNKLDAMLEEYCTISRAVATETKSQLLDLRKAFMDYLKKANDKNQENKILTTDGVHLNDAGNKFVADQMLTALGAAPKKGLLRHVVLFKFKAEVTPAQAQEVADAFAALPKKIDAIEGFEWGTDVSVENKSEGLTHGFVVTFRDEKGRDEYLPHPAHQEFVKLVGPRVEKVIVFDYWAR
jgi:lysophospholipase L1-like esterase